MGVVPPRLMREVVTLVVDLVFGAILLRGLLEDQPELAEELAEILRRS